MKLRKTAAIYAIIVGLAMISIWIIILVTGQDPELQSQLQTEPIAIGLHITSEFITAALLLVGGLGLIANRGWAVKMYVLSMGFLMYSLVNASGLYGQRGNLAFISMFAVIFIFAVVFTMSIFRQVGQRTRLT